MNIKKVSWRNFRSYSNVWTHIEFNDEYSFNGLYGDSGAGKTSISDVIDFCLYKKVRGKRRPWAVLGTLPNRYNKGLECEIIFEKDGHIYNVARGLNPAYFTFLKDGKEPPGGKNTHENMLEELLVIDIDTFKSFVSVDVADFDGFATMKAEDKRKLMDRLLSLDMITEIGKIATVLSSKSLEAAQEDKAAQESLFNLSQKLKVEEEKENAIRKEEILIEIDNLKKDGKIIRSEKEEIEKEEIENKNELTILENEVNKYKKETIKNKSKLEELSGMIERLNQDTCPHCLQKIDENHKHDLTLKIKEQGKEKAKEIKSIESILLEKEKILNELKIKVNELFIIKKNKEYSLNQILEKFNSLKKETEKLETKKGKWEEAYKSSEEKMVSFEYNKNESKLWQILRQLFSEEGIKKDIIAGIIKPLNERLSLYLPKLNLRFNATINSSFEVSIFEGDEEIDIDTLSKGEESRLNLALMMSFLSIIHEKVKINILFLDEVFKPVEAYTAEMCMDFIKKWAEQNKINIIATHHAELPKRHFDRVFYVERKIFSTMIEK